MEEINEQQLTHFMSQKVVEMRYQQQILRTCYWLLQSFYHLNLCACAYFMSYLIGISPLIHSTTHNPTIKWEVLIQMGLYKWPKITTNRLLLHLPSLCIDCWRYKSHNIAIIYLLTTLNTKQTILEIRLNLDEKHTKQKVMVNIFFAAASSYIQWKSGAG